MGTNDDVPVKVDVIGVVLQALRGAVETETGEAIFGRHRIEVGTDGRASICRKPTEFNTHGGSCCCRAAKCESTPFPGEDPAWATRSRPAIA